jgi:2-polyprenyl-3-methyl-5-hydroxy-6-metoxy-1,4-benzoquinol methylase
VSFASLLRRDRQPEIMDQPGLELNRHIQALRGVARLNGWSGSAGILWPPIRALARERAGAPLRLLDVASGAGDLPIRLWRRARRQGLALDLAGCDVSAAAVDFARRQAERVGAAVRFWQQDVLLAPLPDGYDVVTCSLFLHHLEEAEAVELLRRMAAVARRLVLVNDLVRSRFSYALVNLATRLLSRSDVVHTDGPLSVAAAFTPEEAGELARQAGLSVARVEPRWPCRYLLTWRRP